MIALGEDPVIGLLELPRHLRERWWSIAEQLLKNPSVASQSELPEGRGFFEAVLEFLQFKRPPLTTLCTTEIIVHQPGMKSSFSYPAGFPGALRSQPEATLRLRVHSYYCTARPTE